MSKHNVRGTASGEYECSCGARWDRDEGDECPLGRIDGKQVAWQNETMENARVAALNGTLPEPKEVVSADDDPVNLKPIQIGAVERLQEELLKRGMAIVKIDFMESMAQEISSKQATIDGMNEAHWKVVQELAALKAQPSGVVLPPSPYMPNTEPASMTDYERGEAQGRCDMWAEVKRLNPSTASAGDERAARVNDWFLSLPPERQAVLRDDKWLLADAAFIAGQARAALSADTRIVPVKLLRSLLTDLESGMMCNPDPAELQQLRALLDA